MKGNDDKSEDKSKGEGESDEGTTYQDLSYGPDGSHQMGESVRRNHSLEWQGFEQVSD